MFIPPEGRFVRKRMTSTRQSGGIAKGASVFAVIWLLCTILACDSSKDASRNDNSSATQTATDKSADGSAATAEAANREPPVESVPGMAGQSGLNIIAFTPLLISGAVPENTADFALLANHKIKTIISVDGATPDVEEAKRFGIRYVHLPIGYHGIDKERQMEIARAVRDLPGPVYLHCHHGKHRGPAAAASAAVALGMLPNEQAITLMKHAGTSPSYAGLYQCVSDLKKVPDAELDMAPTLFPETAPVPGFVKAMSQVSHAYDHLKQVRDADWQVPQDHPDLVPLAEAGKLENLLRALREDPEHKKYPPDFMDMMEESWHSAVDFEKLLAEKADPDDLKKALDRVGQSCKACHTSYRNKK